MDGVKALVVLAAMDEIEIISSTALLIGTWGLL
jgi:hypothetical protein